MSMRMLGHVPHATAGPGVAGDRGGNAEIWVAYVDAHAGALAVGERVQRFVGDVNAHAGARAANRSLRIQDVDDNTGASAGSRGCRLTLPHANDGSYSPAYSTMWSSSAIRWSAEWMSHPPELFHIVSPLGREYSGRAPKPLPPQAGALAHGTPVLYVLTAEATVLCPPRLVLRR